MEDHPSMLEQYQEKFFDFAADGDISAGTSLVSNINLKNEKGWTALMFAARNGRQEVLKLLLEKGCDAYIINNSGHTALDIAQFWNHKPAVELLSPTDPAEPANQNQGLPSLGPVQKANFFCSSYLDRAAHRRKDNEWLEKEKTNKKTKYVLFSDLSPAVVPLPVNSPGKHAEYLRLLDARYDDILDLLDEPHLMIFLGVELPKVAMAGGGETEGSAWFAVNLDKISDDKIYKIHPHATLLGALPGAMQLVEKESGILAQARSVFAWHDRYQFCPTCGNQTTVEEAGYKRACVKEDCRSRKGVHNTCYPRVDPTVIMAVVSPDKKQILLGRGKRFPKTMWSCLAGFMEPGESIEDACRREVLEESAIHVGQVEYHSCQPWPMPASLMIGCLGYATTMDIKVDPEELQDARWFSRQDAIQMLTHTHPNGLFCPPEQALAHQLIRAWVARTSNL